MKDMPEYSGRGYWNSTLVNFRRGGFYGKIGISVPISKFRGGDSLYVRETWQTSA